MPHPIPRPAPPNGPGHCPRCGRDVIWTLTAENKVTRAVDPDRDPTGNQAVHVNRAGRWISRQLTGERATPEGSEHLHIPHVATCPHPAPRRAPSPRTARGRLGVRPVRWQR